MDPKVKTGLTHAGTALAAAYAMFAFVADNKADLYALWEQLNVIFAQVTKFVAAATPIATAAYGIYRTTTKARMAEIAQDPKAAEIAKDLPVTPNTIAIANALKAAVAALAVGLSLFVLTPGDAFAQGPIARKIIAATQVTPPDGIDSLILKFYATSEADLTVALEYAKFGEDKSAVSCYTEWLNQVQGLNKLRQQFPDPEGIQIITAFQKARNLIKRLDTDSPVRQACAALAADAKSDVKNFISKLVTGAAIKAFLPFP